MRLLIADDDPSLRTALRLVLEDAGHEVLEAEDANQARSTIGEQTVDCALIDAGMYGDGVELWSDLEQDDGYRGRALLLTGNLRGLGILATHARVMGKPFDFEQLLDRIEGMGPRGSADGSRPS